MSALDLAVTSQWQPPPELRQECECSGSGRCDACAGRAHWEDGSVCGTCRGTGECQLCARSEPQDDLQRLVDADWSRLDDDDEFTLRLAAESFGLGDVVESGPFRGVVAAVVGLSTVGREARRSEGRRWLRTAVRLGGLAPAEALERKSEMKKAVFSDVVSGEDAPGLELSDELLDNERQRGAVLRVSVPGVADVLLSETVALAMVGELAWWARGRGATLQPSGRLVAPLKGSGLVSGRPPINFALVLEEVPTDELQAEAARRGLHRVELWERLQKLCEAWPKDRAMPASCVLARIVGGSATQVEEALNELALEKS